MTQQAITNDSFLNLLEELRNELEAISTTNALTTNVEGDDEIEESVTKCNDIVDVIAADLVARHNHNTSGFTHIAHAQPTNTLNNDVLYIGINQQGFACVFNYLSITKIPHRNITSYNCHYFTNDEPLHQLSDLVWWKILENPTYQDFHDEGFAACSSAFISKKTINSNPYQKDTPPHIHWNNGWNVANLCF